ncbi:MAG TPA: hypothetical protein DGG94_01615 [Micromonosporaceae bacterium]|nr:hypothetical protein [Micromonosporaceae bacterium]HCU48525.1 hypothetical protein [Micromonosporaceae bacterium]
MLARMRVSWALIRVALAVILVASLSACANPPGTDDNLVNQWPAMAAPTAWKPDAGVCLDEFQETARRASYKPIDCRQRHRYETVHIGEFTGVAANADATPAKNSEAYRTAWAECDAKASDYLGGPWQERKIWIGVSLPAAASWQGGSRWYLCQMAMVEQVKGNVNAGNTSLKGQFDLPAIQFGCYQVDAEGKYEVKSCTEAHNTEFVGVVKWNSSYESMRAEATREGDKIHVECQKSVATFAGAQVRTGTWNWSPSQADWEAGDQILRCYLYLGTTSVSKSLKGVGAAGWPLK